MKFYEWRDCSVNRKIARYLDYTVCLGFLSPFFDKVILKNKNACKAFKPVMEDDNYEKDNAKR